MVKLPFWNTFETFDREINIEYKQNDILTDDKDTQHIKICFSIGMCWYLIFKKSVSKSLKFGPKWKFLDFEPTLVAIFATMATV